MLFKHVPQNNKMNSGAPSTAGKACFIVDLKSYLLSLLRKWKALGTQIACRGADYTQDDQTTPKNRFVGFPNPALKPLYIGFSI